MEEQLPPMSPDDLAALMGFAGPIFGETRQIENMTSDNPNVGSHIQDGSMKIRQALAQAENQVRMQVPVHVPHVPHVPIPQIPFIPETVNQQGEMFPVSSGGYVPQTTTDFSHVQNVLQINTPSNDQQLEFSFDPNKHDITNNHLRDISNNLKKILKYLEDDSKTKKTKEVIKLATGVR
jgi:hypothetical protein